MNVIRHEHIAPDQPLTGILPVMAQQLMNIRGCQNGFSIPGAHGDKYQVGPVPDVIQNPSGGIFSFR